MVFTNNAFRFLRDLDAHNEVPWFHENKQRYEDAIRTPAFAFIQQWADALADTAYTGEAKKVGGALSPPHKDIRFSKDKRPYRTHIAIRMRHRFVLPGAAGPTLLLWVQPRNVFLSAGVHNPKGEALRRIRDAIRERPDLWNDVRCLGTLDDQDVGRRAGDAAGIERDLHRTHYTITRPLRQSDVVGEGASKRIIEASLEMLPFNQFCEEALYGMTIEN